MIPSSLVFSCSVRPPPPPPWLWIFVSTSIVYTYNGCDWFTVINKVQSHSDWHFSSWLWSGMFNDNSDQIHSWAYWLLMFLVVPFINNTPEMSTSPTIHNNMQYGGAQAHLARLCPKSSHCHFFWSAGLVEQCKKGMNVIKKKKKKK